jgi:hypothetical protein
MAGVAAQRSGFLGTPQLLAPDTFFVHKKLKSTTPRPTDMGLVFFIKREEQNRENGNELQAHKKTDQNDN